MKPTYRIVFAAAAFLATLPAAAHEAPKGVAAAATASTGASKAAPLLAPTTRYCLKGTRPFSRIPLRECRTRDEWMRMGFDPALEARIK